MPIVLPPILHTDPLLLNKQGGKKSPAPVHCIASIKIMNKSLIVNVLINYSKHSPPLLKMQQALLSQLHAYANHPSNKSSLYDIRKTQTSVLHVACMWNTQEKEKKNHTKSELLKCP